MNFNELRPEFPILDRKINGKKLVYLDNAATSQKPKIVLEAILNYYSQHNANVHRGIHTLAEEATEMYEDARKKVAKFIGARIPEEIIFTKGTTESINFIASTLGNDIVQENDVILLTEIEHHSNLVSWQILAQKKNAKLEFVEVSQDGLIATEDFEKKFNELGSKIKVIALTHASNVLGTILDIKEISKLAHKVGAYVIVDGAQAVPHLPVNVQSLDCDAYAFSGHKMLGPTGVGVLWAKKEILEKIEPYQFGGGMIDNVELLKSSWAEIPEKFEAGTPNIEGVIGLGAAVDFLTQIGMEKVREHEINLTKYALENLSKIPNITIYGSKNPEERTGVLAFTIKNLHPHDISAVLNQEGVAVRSGHHCTHPLHRKLNVTATVRASYYLYNDTSDINSLIAALEKAQQILG